MTREWLIKTKKGNKVLIVEADSSVGD